MTATELQAILDRALAKPGMTCIGGMCQPGWNWRDPECPAHWPWTVIPLLIGHARELTAELDEARRTGVVSSGGKSEARHERRQADWDLDDYQQAVTGTRHTPDPRIKSVIVFFNGNVAVCDQDGQQMPQYQGSLASDPLIIDRVRKFSGPDVAWQDARYPTGELP
jgi:hypothetical protein